MNGATAVPSVKIIRPPKSKSIIKIGSNQNFFLAKTNLIISNNTKITP